MRLIKQEKDGCVYASLAMVFGIELTSAYQRFNVWRYNYPFPDQWAEIPRVPSMHEICEIAICHYETAFVHFEYDPEVTPHLDCPPIKVYGDLKTGATADKMFESQMSRGKGLIEGLKNGVGHVVAWDGNVIYDPRGYCYSPNVADRFNFELKRFWLAVKK